MRCIYENSKDVWAENEDIKKRFGTDEERKRAVRTAVPSKYHIMKGTKLPLYSDGWTNEGRLYFNTLDQTNLILKNDGTYWDNMKEHLRKYTRKNHHYSYEQKGCAGVDGEGVNDDEDLGKDDFVVVLPDEMG